jgi:hypothetical protein
MPRSSPSGPLITVPGVLKATVGVGFGVFGSLELEGGMGITERVGEGSELRVSEEVEDGSGLKLLVLVLEGAEELLREGVALLETGPETEPVIVTEPEGETVTEGVAEELEEEDTEVAAVAERLIDPEEELERETEAEAVLDDVTEGVGDAEALTVTDEVAERVRETEAVAVIEAVFEELAERVVEPDSD